MKVVKISGGNGVVPLACSCDTFFLDYAEEHCGECVCMCDPQAGDEESKLESKFVLVP
jgi:hypothetical protein